MQGIYTAYVCRTCRKEIILLTDDVEQMTAGRYLVCSYCSSKRLSKQKVADDLRECMKERSYKRNSRGAIEQRR
jgi:DNA-directed RNA polymerase subunit RPC12/RpoP